MRHFDVIEGRFVEHRKEQGRFEMREQNPACTFDPSAIAKNYRDNTEAWSSLREHEEPYRYTWQISGEPLLKVLTSSTPSLDSDVNDVTLENAVVVRLEARSHLSSPAVSSRRKPLLKKRRVPGKKTGSA